MRWKRSSSIRFTEGILKDVRVVAMTVPNATVRLLETKGLLRVSSVPGMPGYPMQTVFLPEALKVLNAKASFRLRLGRF
jgi:hypothetical protein